MTTRRDEGDIAHILSTDNELDVCNAHIGTLREALRRTLEPNGCEPRLGKTFQQLVETREQLLMPGKLGAYRWPSGVGFPIVYQNGTAGVALAQFAGTSSMPPALERTVTSACGLIGCGRPQQSAKLLLPSSVSELNGESYGLALLIALRCVDDINLADHLAPNAEFAATGILGRDGLQPAEGSKMASKVKGLADLGIRRLFVVEGQGGIPDELGLKINILPRNAVAALDRVREVVLRERDAAPSAVVAEVCDEYMGRWEKALASTDPNTKAAMVRIREDFSSRVWDRSMADREQVLRRLIERSGHRRDCRLLFLAIRIAQTSARPGVTSLTEFARKTLAEVWGIPVAPNLQCQLAVGFDGWKTKIGKYLVSRGELAGFLRPECNVTHLDYPASNVDWFVAACFCWWVGGRLPRLADWREALRQWQVLLDSDAKTRGQSYWSPQFARLGNHAYPAPVTWSDPAAPLFRDIVGNVFQWLDESWRSDLGETFSDNHYVAAGGAYDTPLAMAQAPEGLVIAVDRRLGAPNLGFRCCFLNV
jgi:hypothetical protein